MRRSPRMDGLRLTAPRSIINMTEQYLARVDLYNSLNAYLANFTHSPVRTLADIIEFNDANTCSEEGIPNTHPAFPSGQDGFLTAEATLGMTNATYQAALEYVQYTSGPMGIDTILNPTIDGKTIALDSYLVPADDSAPGFQLAARVGYPIVSVPVRIENAIWYLCGRNGLE
jgi:amidase